MTLTYCSSLFSANIEARIKNEVIFKIYVSGLLKNVFTFNPTWLELLRICGMLSKTRTPENTKTTIFKKFSGVLWFLKIENVFTVRADSDLES